MSSSTGTAERQRQSPKYHKVGVEPDALDATDAQEGESKLMLQPPEFSFHVGNA